MAKIQLKSKDRIPIFAEVDDDDLELVSAYSWTWGAGYARSDRTLPDGTRQHVLMHRLVMDAPSGVIVDHINGIRLDNRRSNLRLATVQQNAQNRRKASYTRMSSDFVGVMPRHMGSSQWKAVIASQVLGIFDTEEEAAYVRDQAAMQLYGEFAHTNFNYEPE